MTKSDLLTSISNTPDWLVERTILLAPSGSYAYGTNTETSDRDYKGICIPPLSYYLGTNTYSSYSSLNGKNFKSEKDTVDMRILHLNQFVKSAMNGTPNDIELLFLESNQYINITKLGQELIDNRHLFLSKQVKTRFRGYAYSVIRKLKSQSEGYSKKQNRQELISQYGYDTKGFMHAVRLLTGAIEILDTGDSHTHRKDFQRLLDCRNGQYSLEEAVELLVNYDSQLTQAAKASDLPEYPDYKEINQFLIGLNLKGLGLIKN